MAGNRAKYAEAMKKAHEHAWDGRWQHAVREYERALQEFPDDFTAHLSLGLAYQELGRPQEALAAYQRASALAPDDPLPLEKVASLQEQLGQRAEAAAQYAKLADLRGKARALDGALAAWQKVVALAPDDAEAHAHIAELLVHRSQPEQAVQEYLSAARLAQEKGEIENAIKYCDQVLALDPFHAPARALRESLSIGKAMRQVKQGLAAIGEQSPISAATRIALSRLAEMLFEEHGPTKPPDKDLAAFEQEGKPAPAAQEARRGRINALIGRAIESQTRGVLDEAIGAYRALLEAGVRTPEVHYNLGVLLFRAMGYDQAIPYLQETTDIADYALASHFALGQCYRAQGQLEKALEHYLALLHLLDDTREGRDRAVDLAQLYRSLIGGPQGKITDPERVRAFIDAITGFLSGPGWEKRLLQMRSQIRNLAAQDMLISFAEIMGVPGSDRLLEGLQRSQRYLEQGLYMAAIEECYWIMDVAPNYLPIHTHLAEIFLRQGKLDQALAKLSTVARTYEIRGESGQAMRTYKRILELSPLDLNARPKLIALLAEAGQVDSALEEYLKLADAYYQLARFDSSVSALREALALAPRGTSDRQWPLAIRKKMAELYSQHLDWGQACAVYQEMKQLASSDTEIRRALVETCFKAGQYARGEAELDELLALWRGQKRAEEALAFLRELAELYPGNAAVHFRLARLLLEAGRKEEAVAVLDALGEYQLEHNQIKEAIFTVTQIVALRPQQLEAYEELLQHLRTQAQQGTG